MAIVNGKSWSGVHLDEADYASERSYFGVRCVLVGFDLVYSFGCGAFFLAVYANVSDPC